MARNVSKGPTPIDAIMHRDKRTNIPTADAQDFITPEIEEIRKVRYARDETLDPQLVWRGKYPATLNDVSDFEDELVTDAPPIYIQDKIDPRVLVENLRRTAAKTEEEPQLALFDTFDSLDDFESIEFYQHDTNWSNRMILGDSLQVMASLAEREKLRGKVQMVYIDPPYGIKFGSNWQVSARDQAVQDGRIEDAAREVEVIKAFRDTWELGIHSYLSYLRERLLAIRDLLTGSGSCFVQIGDQNMHLIRNLMDEVFGSDNFISVITFTKSTGQSSDFLYGISDYLVWYAKDRQQTKFRKVLTEKQPGQDGASRFTKYELPDGTVGQATRLQLEGLEPLPTGARLFTDSDLTGHGFATTTNYDYTFNGQVYRPRGHSRRWKTTEAGMAKLVLAGRILQTKGSLRYKRYLDDFKAVELANNWTDVGGIQSRTDPKIYVVQTTKQGD